MPILALLLLSTLTLALGVPALRRGNHVKVGFFGLFTFESSPPKDQGSDPGS